MGIDGTTAGQTTDWLVASIDCYNVGVDTVGGVDGVGNRCSANERSAEIVGSYLVSMAICSVACVTLRRVGARALSGTVCWWWIRWFSWSSGARRCRRFLRLSWSPFISGCLECDLSRRSRPVYRFPDLSRRRLIPDDLARPPLGVS